MLYRNKRRILILFLVLSAVFSKTCWPENTQNQKELRQEILSKLRDRRCTTMSLDKCDCPDAKEMKAYIDALIELNVGKEEIFYKVAKKFTLETILDQQIKSDVEKRLVKEIGEDKPQIVLTQNSFNFGQVKRSQGKVNANFKLSNKGKASLIINNIKVSCSCTEASLTVNDIKSPNFGTQGAPGDWKAEIKPGESGTLEVTLDLTNINITKGRITRLVTVFSNDPLYPETKVKIEAEVMD